MGLDGLDLLFRLEKRFGLKLRRQEATLVLFETAGTIHHHLVARLRGEVQEVPDIEPVFAQVAAAVRRVGGRWWNASTDLNRRFPPAVRANKWKELGAALGVSLPELEHPPDDAYPRISSQCDSFLSLSRWIAEHHPDRVEWIAVGSGPGSRGAAEREWTEEEVWEGLRECICDALGVRPEEVVPDARMVEDLGMN